MGDCRSCAGVDGSSFREDSFNGMAMRMFMLGAGTDMTANSGPVIGVANSWTEMGPCNAGLRDLAAEVKAGIHAAGGVPIEFPTMSLAEPFSYPTTMLHRNLLALEVEEMIVSSPIDGVVLLNGCDKTVAAHLLGGVSAGKPMLSLGAGPRPTFVAGGRKLTIDDLWEVADRRRSRMVSDADWRAIERSLVSAPGTCNVLGTAISMAAAAEILGLAVPGSTLPVSGSGLRRHLAFTTGQRIVEMVESDRRPRDFLSASALDNAFRLNCAMGGSTNVVIHLAALSERLGFAVNWADWSEIAQGVPLIADVRPVGKGTLEEFHDAGGVPAVISALEDHFDLTQPTADGTSWGDFLKSEPQARSALIDPNGIGDRPQQGLTLLTGSLAPNGAVLKVSGASRSLLNHRGNAVVFEGIEDAYARIDDPSLNITEHSVLVVRNMGPIGAEGMPEIGAPPIPAALRQRGITDMVRITDGRISGTASGTVIVHVSPESAVGGPLALVSDGDEIALDCVDGTIDLQVPAEELDRRRSLWKSPPRSSSGWKRIYQSQVLQADKGCDFDVHHEF